MIGKREEEYIQIGGWTASKGQGGVILKFWGDRKSTDGITITRGSCHLDA